MGEDGIRNGVVVDLFPVTLFWGLQEIVYHHIRLIVGSVAEHVLAGGISYGPDVLFSGFQVFVHLDPAVLVGLHARLLGVEDIGIGSAAGCQENLVRLELLYLAFFDIFGRDDLLIAFSLNRNDLLAGDHPAVLGKHFSQQS